MDRSIWMDESSGRPAVESGMSRRGFLGGIAGTALTTLAVTPAAAAAATRPGEDPTASLRAMRRTEAFRVRSEAARLARQRPPVTHLDNGDEERYATRFATYSKALPHDAFGEVIPDAFAPLQAALSSGDPGDFERIPLGGERRLTNPQAGLAFDLEGADSHHLSIPPPPPVASAAAGAELVELYWMADARDVSFAEYDTDPVIAAACAELTRDPAFPGPRVAGAVAPASVFRGSTAGDLVGPYVSQFLWLDIPMGALLVPQQMRTAAASIDYLTDYAEWLRIQDGGAPDADQLDPTPRYIRSLRDLAQWVHVDALYQAYHQACLILLGMGAPLDPGNPYVNSRCQDGFGTFGGPHILSLVTEVATRALKAVWFQKWFVHRRLRPEAMAGLVHHTRAGTRPYPLSETLLGASVLDRVASRTGTWLLPVAFPEGSPTHPSYGAGHATVAGACVTVLKAWFDESFVIPRPVVADRNGLSLLPYDGAALTVGNELDKLAANVAVGRNAAGVHYRSDYWESLLLGEKVALSVLQEQKATYNESTSFSLRRFNGSVLTI